MFHTLTINDKDAVQSRTLHNSLQNCNYSFANLFGWSTLFGTEVWFPDEATAVFRLLFGDGAASYLINSPQAPTEALLQALTSSDYGRQEGKPLRLVALTDDHAADLAARHPEAIVNPQRNSQDYIYLRSDLESLAGKHLKAKRNHVNAFLSEYPDYQYRPLTPALLDRCMMLEHLWRDGAPHQNPLWGDTIEAEQQVMENVFGHWDELGMIGGAIFIGDEMVAFSYGDAVTDNTFDVCVEKADRSINGAFNIINQQLVKHLPDNFIYINREEDMGLEGLRKAKLAYHPVELLSYNTVILG